MKQYTVAVLGATGAVGQEMMKILAERNFPVGKLIPLASARSAGKTVTFKGEEVTIQEARDDAFEGVDIVLGAAENDIAPPLHRQVLSLLTTPPPSGWMKMYPWWFPKSTPRM